MARIVQIRHTQFPLLLKPTLVWYICYKCWTNIDILFLAEVHTWCPVLCFYLMFFFCSGSHPGFHTTCSCHVSLSSSWLSFSYFPCIWWLWQFWGVLFRHFMECPSIGICLMFFSWLDWDFGFFKERSQCHFQYIVLRVDCQHDLSVLMLTLITRSG